tara:strand:- start:1046 stop:1336 length:291 start_codon:yes stop_codon:yes gene_type:complete
MENKNEENKREDKKSVEQTQGAIQKQTFDINMPDGSVITSDTLDEKQYRVAATMQLLQKQLEQLASQVQEFELKKDHFGLKQKELEDLLGLNGQPN